MTENPIGHRATKRHWRWAMWFRVNIKERELASIFGIATLPADIHETNRRYWACRLSRAPSKRGVR